MSQISPAVKALISWAFDHGELTKNKLSAIKILELLPKVGTEAGRAEFPSSKYWRDPNISTIPAPDYPEEWRIKSALSALSAAKKAKAKLQLKKSEERVMPPDMLARHITQQCVPIGNYPPSFSDPLAIATGLIAYINSKPELLFSTILPIRVREHFLGTLNAMQAKAVHAAIHAASCELNISDLDIIDDVDDL